MHINKNILTRLFILITIIVALIIIIQIYRTGKYIEFLYKCENKTISFEDENIKSIESFDNYRKYSNTEIILKDYELSIKKDNKIIWKTSNEYKVQNFLYCDIDRDSENELVVLLWKKGLFGVSKPFFEIDDKTKWTQHIFIYDYKYGKVKSIWCASKISILIKDFRFIDEDKTLHIKSYDNTRTRFVWDSFGLYNIGNNIFDYNEKEDKIINTFNINAFGDNLIHKQIYEYGNSKNNFDFLYENIKKYLNPNDINVLNQETIFTKNKQEYSDYPYFATPIGVGESIIKSGFNLITLANNHALDKLDEGIETTCSFYDENNVNYIGATYQKEKIPYKIIKKNDIKLAVFNYTYNINKNDNIDFTKEIPYVNTLTNEKQVVKDINDAIRRTDIQIVFVHWGDEYKKEINGFQKKWSKIFIDNGIDIVIGTHPHVLSDYEILKNNKGQSMLVYYSLGNFISFQKGLDRILGGNAKISISNTNHGIKITNYDLLKTITHQERNGYTTVYYYDDYTDELKKRHIQKID